MSGRADPGEAEAGDDGAAAAGSGPRRPAAVIAALAFGRFGMGLHLQLVASLTPFLIADLGFDYSEIGLLIGLFLAPGVLLALPGAVLGARLGYRRLGLVGLLAMTAGTFWLAFAGGFWEAAASRLLAGTGGILLNISFLRLAAALFEGRAMNRAIALVMSSWPVGLGLGAVTYPLLAEAGGWRLPVLLAAGITASAVLSYLALVPEPPRPAPAQGTPAPAGLWLGRLDRRGLELSLLLGLAFSCFTAAGIVFLSFAPAFLTEGSMGLARAGAVTSLIVWAGLIGTPLGGWLADRAGRTDRVIHLGVLGSAVLVVAVLLGAPSLPACLALGIIWGLPAAPFTGMLQRELPAHGQGVGYGLYFTLFYCGFFGFPALAGWLLEVTGTAASTLWLSTALLAATTLVMLRFYRVARQPPRPESGGSD